MFGRVAAGLSLLLQPTSARPVIRGTNAFLNGLLAIFWYRDRSPPVRQAGIRSISHPGAAAMWDTIVLSLGATFSLLTWLLLVLCDSLKGGRP
jgi:hypothetical protein